MRVAMDEQIFAIQSYGGISRLFAELARQFAQGLIPEIELQPLHAPIINRYVLDDPGLARALDASAARNEWTALVRYLTRLSTKTSSDVVHNTFYLPHGLAAVGGAKRVVTIHDMIPELRPDTRRRLDFVTLKRRYVDKADHIICVSQATRSDLLKVYGPVKAPITVVHHGVDSRFTKNAPRLSTLPDRYLLFVGNRSQYKDVAVLFRALAVLKDVDDVRLVCIGGGSFSRSEMTMLQQLGIAHRVMQTQLTDDEIVSAYANAEVFIFPSHFEGFGLPALEAMACGVPVVLAKATSLPEVGADAAMYFEPGDHLTLAGILNELLRDDSARKDLTTRGLDRAAYFTWQRTAILTAEVYRAARGAAVA
ncbi:MAG: glycosyltransferase family 1 protein [Actinomycetota bacterium]|nr:glycosyltransferase family 1 protein [Actinomycetota bacterium]